MSLAAVAVGAAGLIVEVHPNPEKALSDGHQSLTPEQFAELTEECMALRALINSRRRVVPAAVH
jgi:3-deoxy-7-phosphoheptulonate synthase